MNKRKFYDRLAALFIVLGGAAIIVSILAVFIFILLEVMPLFSKPSYSASENSAVSPVFSQAIGVGLDEHRTAAYTVFPDGTAKVFSLASGEIENTLATGAPASSFAVLTSSKAFAIGGSDGVLRIFSVGWQSDFSADAQRKTAVKITPAAEIPVARSALKHTAFARSGDETYSAAAHTADGQIFIITKIPASSEDDFADFFSSETVAGSLPEDGEFSAAELAKIPGETITAISLTENAAFLYAATASGRLLHWDLRDPHAPVFSGSEDVTGDRAVAVTAMGNLLGDRSVAIGDSAGGLSVWFRPADSAAPVRAHDFEGFDGAVAHFSNSPRNRSFAAADSNGNIGIFHATTSRRRLLIASAGEISALTFTPKADAVAAVSGGSLKQWDITDDYPEISLKTIFSAVRYEGYSSPIHMWQSAGGTDEFEPKLGLLPIIFGTFKGALYSLLFAVPVAVLAALCVSHFMHPSFGKFIKPVIEIMAGLPSVVIGFFAGLWLSPVLEKIFSALVIMPFFITAFALLCLYFWKAFAKNLKPLRSRSGAEFVLLIPAIGLAVALSLWLNEPAERLLFQGDYKSWLAAMGLDFDQRNALVVGFAMGFAVIPIVFTIAEDAMSGVPKTLVAASLALGASKWQTAVRVVVPTASPGILSAIVIGFGRAIGETMIVLMATGNTPLLDWNIFNGFRAMSANIAVELPEAPHGGGLYRLIFLTSLLLFLFTFCLNTAAEFMRSRLGRRYGS